MDQRFDYGFLRSWTTHIYNGKSNSFFIPILLTRTSNSLFACFQSLKIFHFSKFFIFLFGKLILEKLVIPIKNPDATIQSHIDWTVHRSKRSYVIFLSSNGTSTITSICSYGSGWVHQLFSIFYNSCTISLISAAVAAPVCTLQGTNKSPLLKNNKKSPLLKNNKQSCIGYRC